MERVAPVVPARRRRHKTRWTVRLADRVSRIVITVAGIGTIIAVLGVLLSLAWYVIPLFASGRIESSDKLAIPAGVGSVAEPVIAAATDEHQLLAWTLSAKGKLTVFRLATGEVLQQRELFEDGPPLTASSLPNMHFADDEKGKKVTQLTVLFGFQNGSVRTGHFRFKGSYFGKDFGLAQRLKLAVGDSARVGTGVVLYTPEKQFYLQELEVDLPDAVKAPNASPVRLLDQTQSLRGPIVCTLTANGKLRYNQIKETVPLDPAFPIVRKLVPNDIPLEEQDRKTLPNHMLLSQAGDQLYLIWSNGKFVRYDVRKPSEARVAERGELFPGDNALITTVRQLIGRATILVGDSHGRISAWFLTNPDNAQTVDGAQLVRGHLIEGPKGASVTAIDVSSRGRDVCAGYSDGSINVFNVTSEKLIVEARTDSDKPLHSVILAPKVDGVVGLGEAEGRHWKIAPGHPEITLASVFGKVWYEGGDRPVHKWESSSGSDAYEPKFGMFPLIFGTFKASLYSLFFAVPLALLAAIYTSEFMRPRVKAVVKPAIEMMASLPSVVLGFLAGLITAQYVEDKVTTVLCIFLFVPLTFVLIAQLVQLLPEKTFLTVNRFRFVAFLFCVPLGLLAAWLVGPVVERLFFAGDLRRWLVDRKASSIGGWLLLFLPVSILITVFIMANTITPWLRRKTASWPRFPSALVDLGRFLGGCVAAFSLALALSYLLSGAAFDARGLFLDTYEQRNALIAAFAIGFAVIPIIYTIAEDALSSVPQHLRSGSLAAGATPWQTALRIVIPTAMSGLFSAVMIGFGRAIGETMIVVMASGNTPTMDMNIFSGFRTLSANIAVEMPEAAKEGSLFRTLFLAAFVLFCMTFVLNTIAEIVRLRFRRRAYQL